MKRIASLALACGWLSVSQVFAECAPRPEKACELANAEGPIVSATVLGPADPDQRPGQRSFDWRVHVDRSYRGALKGDIVIFIQFGDMFSPGQLPVGERFLFYLDPMLPNGDDGLSTNIGCGYSTSLKSVRRAS